MYRTPIDSFKSDLSIQEEHHILTIGSCFAALIGNRLLQNKFDTLVNPYGILFNPISIAKILTDNLSNRLPVASSYLQNKDIYLNYDLHSDFSALNRQTLEIQIKEQFEIVSEFLKKCNYLIITFGTALIYERIDNGHLVANCHKMPAKYFQSRLLEVSEVVNAYDELIDRLTSINPDMHVIISVSPVRHVKDSLPTNSVSKSILRLAAHQLTKNNPAVDYFPAYEIMLDDLRDYRFYKADMLHPNGVAEDYIWQKFLDSWMSREGRQFIGEWEKIRKSLMHKPFHIQSVEHQGFLKTLLMKLQMLPDGIDVKEEIKYVEQQITTS